MGQGTRGGRLPGSRNKRTQALLELAEDGESPCSFALRVMRDETTPIDLRVQAAKLAAPFIHPRPQPAPRLVTFPLPEQLGSGDLVKVHEALLRATAAGELAIDDARDVGAMIETQRRLIETLELEERIAHLEKVAR